METDFKFIHLLYVPTMACNMGCKYCYLEDNTVDLKTDKQVLETLKFAVNKFRESNVIPFNISLHGGEVTVLPKNDFHDLIEYISNYYHDNNELVSSHGFKVGNPHIKTNLYQIEKHIDTIKEFNVSISGSLDLPFSLHSKYRVTKDGKDTLDKILKNIELLKDIPNKKKVSATIFQEHFEYLDDIVKDIWYLHKNTCLDMNDFNFMIGFPYNSCGLLHGLDQDKQVELFQRMHQEFDGTELDLGVNGPWFAEFGPEYCTNCDNCGEKFFLLEKNGDIYSCVRGQKNPDYYYGNIFQNSIEEILNNAKSKILMAHNRVGFDLKCSECKYLYLCKTGCPFVKNVYQSSKSYTCLLQQELYKKNGYSEDEFPLESAYLYTSNIHPEISSMLKPRELLPYPSLEDIIKDDKSLKNIYSGSAFIFSVDGVEYNLESQVLRTSREIIYITPESDIKIYMKKKLIEDVCDYPENNALYIMLLSGDTVTYGDERRNKQRHVMTHQVYKGVLDSIESDKKCYYMFSLNELIKMYKNYISMEKPNNIFFTTTSLRDYHYTKQKNNAYYHIQAINLPFQNIEFYYIDKES